MQFRLEEEVVLQFELKGVHLPRRECPVGLLVDYPRVTKNRTAAQDDEEAAVRVAAVACGRAG